MAHKMVLFMNVPCVVGKKCVLLSGMYLFTRTEEFMPFFRFRRQRPYCGCSN